MPKLWNATSAAITRLAVITILLTSYFGLAGAVQATEVRQPSAQHDRGDNLRPTGKGWGEFDPSGMVNRLGRGSNNNGISYHGGPVLLDTVNVYYIWYGPWTFTSTNSTYDILNGFGTSIGGTPYFNINTTYYNSTPTHVSGLVTLLNNITDTGSQGLTLNDSAVQNIVANALAHGLPTDTNGVYFVLTSKDVTETSGFCTQYCAWHTHGTINGKDIKYGFIGDPMQCPSACSAVNQTTAPNSNAEADSMANLIAHELAESTTDPDLNAWFDNRGFENADKCAWKFGTTSSSNVSFGGRNWLLQENWVNAKGGYCALHYP
jgi:Phosphate-induced protein 1 conserved region